MRFALYCRELRGAGARAVGVGLLSAFARAQSSHEIVAYIPDDETLKNCASGNIKVVSRPISGGWRQAFAYSTFRKELEESPPDAIFMLGSRALTNSRFPQAVLCHNPWQVYPESEAWKRCSYRDYLYRIVRNSICGKSLAHAQVIAAQTPVMMRRFHDQFNFSDDRLALIPNSVTAMKCSPDAHSSYSETIAKSGHQVRAICLSRYYTHKNIDVFIAVADELLRRGRTDIGIFVTLDPSHGNGVENVIAALNSNSRNKVVHNLGQIPIQDVPSCYRAANAMILPTLMESFTNTYVDAMSAGVPILTSDLDFARTVCGDAAFYFPPTDVNAICSALESVSSDTAGWSARIETGKTRVTHMPTWDDICARTIELLECVAQKKGVSHLNSMNDAVLASPAV